MTELLWQSSLVALVGGVISLDRTSALQIMVSRPIVTAPVIGLLFGEPGIGLMIGSLVELLWIGELPVGGVIPPHETAASVIAVGMALGVERTLGGFTRELIALIILLVIPMAMVCQKVDKVIRGFNTHLSRLAERQIIRVARYNLMGLVAFLLPNLLLFFIFIFLGTLGVSYIAPYLHEIIRLTLLWEFVFIPLIGMAVVFNMVRAS